MWCPTCRADVAAELSFGERSLVCARCATELAVSPAVVHRRVDSPSRDAAEVLARWSAEDLLPMTASAVSHPTALPPTRLMADAETPEANLPETPIREVPPQRSGGRKSKGTNSWVAMTAQLAAYAGVLLLTCGGTLVISSQFGAAPQRALSGWLMANVGQMLLFLGVITLVSHGVDQARAEVARGVKRLNRRLQLLELRRSSSEEPQSPKKHAA